jgi:hypothetical protein
MIDSSAPQPTQASFESLACPVCRQIDRGIKIRLRMADDHVAFAWQWNTDPTALVLAAARTVDVGKVDRNSAEVNSCPVEREFQAPLRMLTKTLGKNESTGFDVDPH